MTEYVWRIWCNVDSRWERVISATAPTTCPTNGSHAVNALSVSKESKVQKPDKVMMADAITGQILMQKNNYHYVGMTALLLEEFWKHDTDLWSDTTDGAGSKVELLDMGGGIMKVFAGNVNGNSAVFESAKKITSLDTAPILEIRAQLLSNTEQRVELGMQKDSNNHSLFFVDTSVNGNLVAQCCNGGITTQQDTGVIMDTAWHRYSIDSISGNVFFGLDGNLVATIGTNLPTDPMNIYNKIICQNGGQRSFCLDYIKYTSDRPGYVEGSGRRGGFTKREF